MLGNKAVLNKKEAPPGYVAMLKASASPPGPTENICRHCDFRPACNAHEWPCMSYSREDGCSVVFKYTGEFPGQ